jgi:predicted phage terminase large subunit-like protein
MSLRDLQLDHDRRRAEKSLSEFTKMAWHVIEPGTPYIGNWHLDTISEHLEAVTRGDIRNLLINVPPRHMKSIQVAVMWPVWVWMTRPQFRWLFASYAGSLSVRDSLKCRRLIESPWFQARWGHRFALTGDQNAKTFFENDKSGYRFATSVGASTTGHGGDILVVDDPHNSMEAQSDTMRETTLEWWDQAMSTRLNNPKTGCKVIVMQRLHENDLSGHVLRQGGWDHLCLPAEFEKGRRSKTTLGNYDPRTEDGELLWKGRFGSKEIDELKVQLGEYGTSGQLQQRPSPAAGGIIKRDWFNLLPADDPLPKLMYVVQSYDTAFTEKTQNDPTACSTWGVFNHANGKAVVLLDCWKEHLSYPDLRKKMGEEYKAKYGDKDKTVDVVLIEEKGSGISLMQDLRRSGVPCHPYNPGRADKVTRVHAVAPLLESGLVYLPESKKTPGRAPAWTDAMMHELMIFPNGEHDDMVDSMTQALIYLRDTRMLSIDNNKDEYDQPPPRDRSNPYAA